jgi:hypothetical protein
VPPHLTHIFVALLSSIPLFAEIPLQIHPNEAAVVARAQEAAVRALNFHQGDVGGFTHARADFSPDGWKAFMKHMEGWLDQKGAPTFSSSFVPSRDAAVVGNENGIVHLRIPGTLKHIQNQSSTTYRAAIDVHVGGTPMKIQLLEQVVCAGASTACQ